VDLNKKYQEKYMLILHPKKRKIISKKDCRTNIYGQAAAATKRFYHNITG